MIKRNFRRLIGAFALLFLLNQNVIAQDTLRINLPEFLQKGLEASGQVAYEGGAVDLAHNRAEMAKSQRILPQLNLSSQHGMVPGVVSQTDLPEGQYYLDPNLENNWEDWAIFTRIEVNALQPIFTWGAIDNAINAAILGARAAEFEFGAVKAEAELQLYELYYSYLLAIEISRILDDADEKIDIIQNTIDRMLEDGDPDLKESDIFKFELFLTEFEVQRVEVRQAMDYVKRVWHYALQATPEEAYLPAEDFLDPVPFQLENFDYYQQIAMESRPELRGVESGIDALRSGLSAARAQQLPLIGFGITGSYANTPNRPRQTNPFIRNNTNYASAAVGLVIRQNLNFSVMKTTVDRAKIEYRRVNDLHKAVSDGIILELNERYQEAVVAETRMHQTEEALVIARNWARNEQLNYDIGFGDVEDLLDAMQTEVELQLRLKQNVFDLNIRIASLYKAGGISINQLTLN